MEYCRLQIGCLLIVAYIGFIYFRECKKYHKKLSSSMFDEIDPVIAEVFLDSREKVERIHNEINTKQ